MSQRNIIKAAAGDTFNEVSNRAKTDAPAEFMFNGILCKVDASTDLDLLHRDLQNAFTLELKTIGPNCAVVYSNRVRKALQSLKDKRIADLEDRITYATTCLEAEKNKPI